MAEEAIVRHSVMLRIYPPLNSTMKVPHRFRAGKLVEVACRGSKDFVQLIMNRNAAEVPFGTAELYDPQVGKFHLVGMARWRNERGEIEAQSIYAFKGDMANVKELFAEEEETVGETV